MKMRLDINFKAKAIKRGDNTYSTHFTGVNSSVLLKYVSYVIIDGKKHHRPHGDSKEIQTFYYFVDKNRRNITEIMGRGEKHYFMKDGYFHSYDTYCYHDPQLKTRHYAVDGYILTPEEGKRFMLKKKLEKLIKQSK